MAQIVIKRKKQGMKSLIKKLVELQHLSVSVGIHKGDGRRKVPKKKISVAMLAKSLETFASWTQPSDVTLKNADGTWTTIKKGARMTRPARYFISFFKHLEVWNKFRHFVQNQARELIQGKVYKPRFFMGLIGSVAEDSQRFIMQTGKTEPNSALTVKIKGKNMPLVDTRMILGPAIKSKVRNDRNGMGKAGKAALKLSDADYVDKLIKNLKMK